MLVDKDVRLVMSDSIEPQGISAMQPLFKLATAPLQGPKVLPKPGRIFRVNGNRAPGKFFLPSVQRPMVTTFWMAYIILVSSYAQL